MSLTIFMPISKMILLFLIQVFSAKIDWFRGQAGDECVLLPHRIEFTSVPDVVDRFFIDGPIAEEDLRRVIPNPSPAIGSPYPGGTVYFESPRNPHSGCFVLTGTQLQFWTQQDWWQDGDCSLISPCRRVLLPLESQKHSEFLNQRWPMPPA